MQKLFLVYLEKNDSSRFLKITMSFFAFSMKNNSNFELWRGTFPQNPSFLCFFVHFSSLHVFLFVERGFSYFKSLFFFFKKTQAFSQADQFGLYGPAIRAKQKLLKGNRQLFWDSTPTGGLVFVTLHLWLISSCVGFVSVSLESIS